MKDKKADTRKFIVHDKRTPGLETVVIEHDLGEITRSVYGKDKKQDKPADVIPLKRDG